MPVQTRGAYHLSELSATSSSAQQPLFGVIKFKLFHGWCLLRRSRSRGRRGSTIEYNFCGALKYRCQYMFLSASHVSSYSGGLASTAGLPLLRRVMQAHGTQFQSSYT